MRPVRHGFRVAGRSMPVEVVRLVPLRFRPIRIMAKKRPTKTIKWRQPEQSFRERDSTGRDFGLAMMEPNHTRLCARAAIAAALALASTPLLAQVAEAPPPA